MKLFDFLDFKKQKRKISMITCTDAAFARSCEVSDIDCLLVGDSVAMTVWGYPSTLSATTSMMVSHTEAVRRGAPHSFIVTDMPFLSFRKDKYSAVEDAGQLMCAGADAVKLEGIRGHEEVITHLVQSGIPVMGHLGLTPQSIHTLGGYKVQGKIPEKAILLKKEARELESLGCFALVLECVPAILAKEISELLSIPVIGIGAGSDTDGQVLVLYDLLGMETRSYPRFVRKYSSFAENVKVALNNYSQDVREGKFPSDEESY